MNLPSGCGLITWGWGGQPANQIHRESLAGQRFCPDRTVVVGRRERRDQPHRVFLGKTSSELARDGQGEEMSVMAGFPPLQSLTQAENYRGDVRAWEVGGDVRTEEAAGTSSSQEGLCVPGPGRAFHASVSPDLHRDPEWPTVSSPTCRKGSRGSGRWTICSRTHSREWES